MLYISVYMAVLLFYIIYSSQFLYSGGRLFGKNIFCF